MLWMGQLSSLRVPCLFTVALSLPRQNEDWRSPPAAGTCGFGAVVLSLPHVTPAVKLFYCHFIAAILLLLGIIMSISDMRPLWGHDPQAENGFYRV